MRTLHLTLTKKWFDLIASGEKSQEYREIKPYWSKRLLKPFDVIKFKNGYSRNAPHLCVEFKGILKGIGKPEWGAPEVEVYIIQLGRILYGSN